MTSDQQICRRMVIDTGINRVAVDYNLMKEEVLVSRLAKAVREESGLYVLKHQHMTSDWNRIIDQQIVPVNFNEMLNMLDEGNRKLYDENIVPGAYVALIRRGGLGMAREIIEDEKKKELNLTIGLIVNSLPVLEDLEGQPVAKYYIHGQEIISALDLVPCLEKITDRFCERYPKLSQYYPFSKDFKYKQA